MASAVVVRKLTILSRLMRGFEIAVAALILILTVVYRGDSAMVLMWTGPALLTGKVVQTYRAFHGTRRQFFVVILTLLGLWVTWELSSAPVNHGNGLYTLPYFAILWACGFPGGWRSSEIDRIGEEAHLGSYIYSLSVYCCGWVFWKTTELQACITVRSCIEPLLLNLICLLMLLLCCLEYLRVTLWEDNRLENLISRYLTASNHVFTC